MQAQITAIQYLRQVDTWWTRLTRNPKAHATAIQFAVRAHEEAQTISVELYLAGHDARAKAWHKAAMLITVRLIGEGQDANQ